MLSMIQKRLLHIGQTIPQLKLTIVSGNATRYSIETDIDSLTYFSNKKIVLVGFPGAFTPVCTNTHIPEYVKLYEKFKEKKVEVVGLAMNDPFVLKEFGEQLEASFPFISDGSGNVTKALEAGLDLSSHALGFRTRRFVAIVENGTITMVHDEKSGALTDVSQADTILTLLKD